ncbi:MAG: hypothetical protein AAF529_13490, partial [Pseudomonadota bacterium]
DVFAVVMVAVGDWVLAEKKGTSNTSGSKVIEARVEWIDVMGPRFGHPSRVAKPRASFVSQLL